MRVPAVVLLAVAACGCASHAAAPAVTRRPAPAVPAADALDDDGVYAVVSPCGYRLVVNDGAAHLTVDLLGTSVTNEKRGEDVMFHVDDLTVQVVHVSRAQLGASATGKRGLDLLRAHEAWESDYIRQQTHARVEPREVELELRGAPRPAPGLMWWFPMPDVAGADGVDLHRYWAYATIELGGHVVGLSAVAQRGLEPLDVMGRLASWMATLRASEAKVSVLGVSTAIKDLKETDARCPAFTDVAPAGIDRRLRLQEVPRGQQPELIAIAEQAGGVERQVVAGHLRYRNHVCRFAVTYPDDGWSEFFAQDFSETGCMVNLVTPLVYDADAKQKITNAVVVRVARAKAGFGVAELEAQMEDVLQKRGGHFQAPRKPLFDGAIGRTYEVDTDVARFAGEMATVRRGELLYNVCFSATRGTLVEGRKNFERLLATLELDVP